MQTSRLPGGPLPGLTDFFSVELLNPQTGQVCGGCWGQLRLDLEQSDLCCHCHRLRPALQC